MQIEIKFLLLHLKVQTLQDAQKEAISLEDDMILSGMKCKEITEEGIYLYEFFFIKSKSLNRKGSFSKQLNQHLLLIKV